MMFMAAANVTIKCDRCGKMHDGIATMHGTSGYYWVAPESAWQKYAQPGERYLCERCMWDDPAYIKDYGRHE
jgi:hypothetical protein